MVEFMAFIEELSGQFQYTLQAIAAFGTLAAVAVSIYLANQANRIRLKANASVWLSVQPGTKVDKDNDSTICAQITNLGLRPVWFSSFCFYWKVPFCQEEWAVDLVERNIQFPYELKPGQNVLIHVQEVLGFKEEMLRCAKDLRLAHVRLKFTKAYLCTQDGYKIKVSIQKPLREKFKLVAKSMSS